MVDTSAVNALAAQLAASTRSPGVSVSQGVVTTANTGATPPNLSITLSGSDTVVDNVRYMDSYMPTVGDGVLVLKQDGAVLVIGRILSAPAPTANFQSQVETVRLDQMAAASATIGATLNQIGAPTANVSLNSHKITNLTPGSASTDAATFGQIPVTATGMTPVHATDTSTGASSTTPVRIIVTPTVSIPASTLVRVSLAWDRTSSSSTSPGNNASVSLVRDSTTIGGFTIVTSESNTGIPGGTFQYWDDNPSAGNHTYSFWIASQGTGTFTMYNGTIAVETSS